MRLECRMFGRRLPHHSVATVSSRSSASCTLHYDASSRHRSNRNFTLDVKLEIVQWSRKVLECCKEWQHLDASGAVSISVHRGWASWPHPASVLSTCFTDMVGEFSFDQKPSTVGQPDETFGDYVCNRKNMNG